MKLDDQTLKNIGEKILGEKILLTRGELRHMRRRDKELFLVGMTVMLEAHSRGTSLEEQLSYIRSEILAKHRELIMRGVEAVRAEIEKAQKLLEPVPGTNTVFTIVATKEVPEGGKVRGPSITMGSLPTMEHVRKFVESGGLPAEYPYYVVIVSHVNFYVLVSDEFTSEEMHEIAREFGNVKDDAWKRLIVRSGPHSTPRESEDALERLSKSGERWKGAHLASMTDEDAAILKRAPGSAQ